VLFSKTFAGTSVVLWALRGVQIHVVELPLPCRSATGKTDDIVRAGREVSAALSLRVIPDIGRLAPIEAMFAVRTGTLKARKEEPTDLRCWFFAFATVVMRADYGVALWGIVEVIVDVKTGFVESPWAYLAVYWTRSAAKKAGLSMLEAGDRREGVTYRIVDFSCL
jgi:hypothetical protein